MTQIDAKPFDEKPRSRAALVHDEETFEQMVAEQLRRAPWLLVSAAAHAVAIMLLWALVPPEAPAEARHHATVQDTAQQPVQPVARPEPVATEPELMPDEIELVEPTITASEDLEFVVDSMPTATPSAFDANQWNTTNGLGGGGGGPPGGSCYARRGHGAPAAFAPRIRDALTWLARHQDEDGRWDCDQFMKHDTAADGEICDGAGSAMHDVGVTGLALLAFLGDGNTMRGGEHRDAVRRGVRWLRSQQQDNGLFGSPTSHDFIYDHAIASYAMCEAYGLSHYRLLEPVAQKALDYLEAHRNPYGVWRYQPGSGDNDTSVTGWAIMALESGSYFGLTVNRAALQNCAIWLDQVADESGRHGYSKRDEPSSRKPGDHAVRFPADRGEAMTAVGLFCRYFMGQDPADQPVMRAAADRVLSRPPAWDEQSGAIDHYYWYYATYALFQAGGRHWQQWQRGLGKALLPTQHQDRRQTNLYGSWDPAGAWGEDGGRVYSTALLGLCLQAHSRYTRLIR